MKWLLRQMPAGCLGLVVHLLLLFPAVGFADSDLRAEVEAQTRHIAALERLISCLGQDQGQLEATVANLEGTREQIQELNDRIVVLRGEVAAIEVDLQAMADEFAEYCSDYRKWVRIEAVGEEYPFLSVAGGKIYRDVVVRRVTDAGLEITHSAGPTRLRHDQLPMEFRDRFQWSDEAAAELLAQEEKDAFHREQYIAMMKRQQAEKREEAAREAATEKRIASLERQLAAVQASSAISRIDSSGALGGRRRLGSGSTRTWYDDYYDRIRPTIYYYNAGTVSRGGSTSQTRFLRPRSNHDVPGPVRNEPRAPRPVPTPPMQRCPNGTD